MVGIKNKKKKKKLRTITSDQTVYTVIRRFLFSTGRHDIAGQKRSRGNKFIVRFAYFVSHQNILKTEKMLQFWDKRFSTLRGTSFQREMFESSGTEATIICCVNFQSVFLTFPPNKINLRSSFLALKHSNVINTLANGTSCRDTFQLHV